MLKEYFYQQKLLEIASTHGLLLKSRIYEVILNKTIAELSISKFNSLGNELFEGFKKLESFQLHKLEDNSEYQLSDTLFKGCIDLKFIDLSYCELTMIDLNIFSDLPKLTRVNLSNNEISEIIQLLELQFNKLTEIKSTFFNKFTNLRRLDLSSNLIERLKTQCFFGCELLESVNLSSNPKSSIDLDKFSGMEKLKTVDLSRNNINELLRPSDDEIYIENLRLYNNVLQMISAKYFKNWPKLKNLSLKNNLIRTIEPKSLDSLKQVT